MKRLKLSLALAVMFPAWAILGAFTTLDSGGRTWLGLTVGAGIGVFGNVALSGCRVLKAFKDYAEYQSWKDAGFPLD